MYAAFRTDMEENESQAEADPSNTYSRSNPDLSAEEEEEDDDEMSLRFSRFVDTGENSDFFKAKTVIQSQMKPFYNGETLDKRMAEIRKSIYHIRENWDGYEEFLKSLERRLRGSSDLDFKDPKSKLDSERFLTIKRDWLTKEQASSTDITYDAVRVYTSIEGYAGMYKLGNEIFREEDSISLPQKIRDVVFLVELINIDLFNYCLKCPEKENFEGVVYRGLCLNDEDLETFRSLRKEPISRRNIAVPLGLFSGSNDLRIARRFITQNLKKWKGDKPGRPLVIKIHVIGLKKEYVEHYTNRFPAVLTTICAVDIHKISSFPPEKEVLLRGPFMQILDVYEDASSILKRPCDVLEAVMLNANRDHISTSQLGDEDALARDLFATMVAVTRSEFAKKFCEEKGLVEDAQEYQNIMDTNLAKLETLMKK